MTDSASPFQNDETTYFISNTHAGAPTQIHSRTNKHTNALSAHHTHMLSSESRVSKHIPELWISTDNCTYNKYIYIYDGYVIVYFETLVSRRSITTKYVSRPLPPTPTPPPPPSSLTTTSERRKMHNNSRRTSSLGNVK